MFACEEWNQDTQNGLTDTSLLQQNYMQMNATLVRFWSEATDLRLLSSLTSA